MLGGAGERGKGRVLRENSRLTDFGQAGHKYPECNDIRILDVIPFERDDGKALRLAAILRACRASVSQRRWESHQPQEEHHSRYLPHLQATQQKLCFPFSEKSRPFGGPWGRDPCPLRETRPKAAADELGVRCEAAVPPQPALSGSGAAGHGVAKERPGAPCIGRCFQLGSWCLPAPAFIGLFPSRGGGALPPLPRRLQRGASDVLSGSAGQFRSAEGKAVGCVRRPGSALGTWCLVKRLLSSSRGWGTAKVEAGLRVRQELDEQEIRRSPFGCWQCAAQRFRLPLADPRSQPLAPEEAHSFLLFSFKSRYNLAHGRQSRCLQTFFFPSDHQRAPFPGNNVKLFRRFSLSH